MANKAESEGTVFLNVRVRKQMRHDFAVWCATHDRKMSEVVVALVERVLSGALKPPPRRPPRKPAKP